MGFQMNPDENIGPFYKLLALILTVVASVLAVFQVKSGYGLGGYDLGLTALFVLAIRALLRPTWFCNLAATIADALPFLSFKKKDNQNGGGLDKS